MRRYDRENMLDIALSLGDQILAGLAMARGVTVGGSPPSQVFVAGMGGSGIAGELLASWLNVVSDWTIRPLHGYHLPASATEDDLVVGVSYSGDTAETLAVVRHALRAGCRIAGVSSGGKLLARGKRHRFPVLLVPKGLPPRGALGYLFAALVALLESFDGGFHSEVRATAVALQQAAKNLRADRRQADNAAKVVAKALDDRTPVVYGIPRYAAVARRWQTQFNENAKVLAWWGVLPEAGHNEIVGWADDDRAAAFVPVLLRDVQEPPALERQLEGMVRILRERGEIVQVREKGKTFLERMMRTVLLGDAASVYLAVRRRKDPTPVPAIDRLKAHVAQAQKRG